MLPDVCLVQRSFHFQFSFFHHCSNSNRYYNFSFTFSPGSFCSPFVCLIRRQFKTKNCLITFEVLNWLKFFSMLCFYLVVVVVDAVVFLALQFSYYSFLSFFGSFVSFQLLLCAPITNNITLALS